MARTLRALVQKHPVLAYFALTFALSWGSILLVFGLGPISATQLETQAAFLYVALLAGPSLAGLTMTGLVSGRAGFRELRRRLLRWRVNLGWYAVAVLAAPLTLLPVLFALRLGGLAPDVFTTDELGARVLTGVGAGLAVALCEELGWTGFAVLHLRARFRVIAVGALLGFVWGAWHFPPFWEADSFAAPLAFGLLLARLFSWLPAFRVLMVWVHDRTHSLLVVIIMHMSLVATQLIFVAPFTFEGRGAVAYILAWALILWIAAGLVTTKWAEAAKE